MLSRTSKKIRLAGTGRAPTSQEAKQSPVAFPAVMQHTHAHPVGLRTWVSVCSSLACDGGGVCCFPLAVLSRYLPILLRSSKRLSHLADPSLIYLHIYIVNFDTGVDDVIVLG